MEEVVGEGSSTSSPPNKYLRLNEDEDEYCLFGQEDEDKYVSRMYDYLSTEDEEEDEYTMRPVIKDEDEDEDDEDEDVLRLLSSTDEPGPMKDADVPRLLPSVDPLPDGAWELWGSRAIYFAAKDVGACRYTYQGNIIYTGLSIYAINPTDQRLPVYHLFDFSFPSLRPVTGLTFAIVGSVAYVAGNERLWMRQIGDNEQGYWEDGPLYDMYNCTPLLFSLGGRLYALCYFGVPDPCKDPTSKGYTDAFQVLVDGSWRSLKAPPPCFGCSGLMIGWSCVGDHTIIVHVRWKPVQQHFYCFRHSDGFSGRWTELDVTPSPSSSPSLCDFVVYCAHLGSNDPLFLFLPVLSRTTMFPVVFGLSGDRLHLGEVGREVELPWEEPYHMNHLISMGGNRYCAFAFPTEGKLDINIFTFDLHLHDYDDGAAPSVKIVHSQRHGLGRQEFCKLMCGKAYFSSN